jgi:hypothetical protein
MIHTVRAFSLSGAKPRTRTNGLNSVGEIVGFYGLEHLPRLGCSNAADPAADPAEAPR